MKPAALYAALLALALPVTAGCAPSQPAPPAAPAGAASTEQSILARSNPAAGSTVPAPVDKLELWFDPPARLHEVTVTGPEGTMPMMVSAVGEVEYYSLPMSASEPGEYTVAWRATAAGQEYRGSFRFTLR